MSDFDFENLEPVCETVTRSFSDETLGQFMAQLDEIPNVMANSTTSTKDKLISMQNANIFIAINEIFKNQVDVRTQLKILKFWDFVISTCSSPEELAILFTDNVTNNLINYHFDFTSTEVIQSYVTVLKGISLKAKKIDPANFLTQNETECPLYSHCISFISSKDSIVVSAARLVVLNMCLIKYPPLQAFISDQVSREPLESLIENIGEDELSFLGDFLNVAPLTLKSLVITRLRKKLTNCALPLLCRAATFLCDSPAHSMLVETLSTRIHMFPVTSPLTLGLLLYCLEKRLILLDAAIKWGLIQSPEIPRFSKETKKVIAHGDFCDELKEVLTQRLSIPCTALSLRCLEMIYKDIPKPVLDVNTRIMEELKTFNSNKIVQIILESPEARQRCDIEFLLENQLAEPETDDEKIALLQLAEVQSSIGRWRGKRFQWFTLGELSNDDANTGVHSSEFGPIGNENVKEFRTVDDKTISLSKAGLTLTDGRKLPTSSIYLKKKNGKVRKYADIVYVQFDKNARSIIALQNKKVEQFHIEFPSTSVSLSFEAEMIIIQKELMARMFEQLEK
ncbi:hypothetical protein TRFO_07518 [Tritrichomonas foetus]|uniref:FPL domain-containing protein n=1 Tax=Tritrichomonas foetus TaxID=1144522 RepID=A0A1J4JS74_9EUKA|nr:hypothetical protein TRFO_07518 [Tritrichomonas foetus]|eukprot:OHT01610.1 hypothetical protein TRFO_07518 [Tritrichomonas foetus]